MNLITPINPLLRWLTGLLTFLLPLALVLMLSGCIQLTSEPLDDEPSSTPTPATTPQADDVPSGLESSIVAIREMSHPEELRGSAIVLTSDGLLLTAIEVAGDDIEIVLADGSAYQPALVSLDPSAGLALLRIPRDDLTVVEISSARPSEGAEVVATGYDGSPGTMGHMSGRITESQEATDDIDFRTRGSVRYETDISHLTGFIGGALSDSEGRFCGIVLPGNGESGAETLYVASHWYIAGWMEARVDRLEALRAEAVQWDVAGLPGDWTIRQPDGWGASVQTDDDQAYRSELNPADPDIPLQLAISVESNDYGTDPTEFIDGVFSDRTSARIWSVTEEHDRPLVRATMVQEGALLDVAYVLDDDFLIAISLRSGYQLQDDPEQVDQARALFEVVVESIDKE